MNEISKLNVNGSLYSILDDELKNKNVAIIENDNSSATVAGFDPQTDTLWKSAQILTEGEKTQVKDNLGLTEELDFIYEKLDETGVGWVTSSYIIDLREVDGNPKLPADIITNHKPAMLSTDKVYIDGKAEYRDVFARIRSHSHLYIGRYDTTTNKLNVRQVSDTDKTQWVDGTSIVWGTEDDMFMKLPRFWWKSETLEEDVVKVTVTMSEDYIDNLWHGLVDNLWHEWEGNTFIGVYKGSISDGKLYSKTGVTPTVNKSFNFVSNAVKTRYNNDNYRFVTYEAHLIMALLGFGWFGNPNVRTIVGKGASTYPKTTGLCDAKGMTDSSINVDGNDTSINFWGIENWWGDVSEFVDNIKTKDSNGTISILGADRTTEIRTVSCPGNTGVGLSEKCMTKLQLGTNFDVLPKKIIDNGNYDRGFCAYSLVSPNVDQNTHRFARRSGFSNNIYNNTILIVIDVSVNTERGSFGSRLLYEGNYEIVDSLEE